MRQTSMERVTSPHVPISPKSPHSVRSPLMYQRWEHLTFLHWEYQPAVISALLPDGIELDTFGGSAWVGLVPFVLTNLRPLFLPVLPWVGHFPETNVRTYVRGPDGRPGTYFFTLDADRLLAVLAARLTYHLPYRWARMRVAADSSSVSYQSERHPGSAPAFTDIRVRPGERICAGEFDNFLTARFSLYTSALRNRVLVADIEHPTWPLQSATVPHLRQNLIESCGIPIPVGAPVAHYSRRVDMCAGGIRSASKLSD